MAMREEQQQQQQECDFCESSNNNNNSKITSRQRSPQQPRHRQQQQQPRTRRPYRIFTIHVGVWSVCLLLLVTTLSSFSIGNNNMMRFRGVSAWSLSPSSNSLRRTASSFGSRNSDNSRSLTMSIDSRELRFFYGGSSTLDHVFRHQHQPFSSSSSSSSSSAVLENTRQQSDAFIAVAEGARNIASMSHQHRHSTQSSSSSSTAPCVKTYANSKHQTTATTTTQFERTATTTVTKTTVYASSSRKARTTTTTSSSSSSTTSGLTVHSAAAAFANSGICSSGSLSASSSRYGFYQSSAFPFSTGKEQDESSSSSSDSSFPLDSSFPSSAFFSPAGSWNHDSSSLQFPQQHHHHHDYYHQLLPRQPKQGYGTSIQLTEEECALFTLLRQVRRETGLDTTLRVAGGWVRDKLLATPEFQTYHTVFDVGTKQGLLRLTSKFRKSSAAASAAAYSRTTGSSSAGRQGTKVLLTAAVNGQHDHQPVDIDIALDDMLGREFADHLNEYLTSQGAETVSVGVVLKNPEKSKHLETATMKVGSFWIDFVNLRAEEYTQESRIPDLMRIGSASEDAFRRDLTINALFYNINTGQVEDWTGRGFDDLRKGIVATPLPPLTTLLDDPLRVLRSVRFAARLRFGMDEELCAAARDERVKNALAQKVSRERVGSEVDLMLRSPDPVGAMRLLIDLNLVDTVFPIADIESSSSSMEENNNIMLLFAKGLSLLTMAHDHLADCRWSPPLWCKTVNSQTAFGTTELRLIEDEETRRQLWYAAFLKPIWDQHRLAIHREEVAMELAEQQQAVNAGQTVSSSKQRKAGRCKKDNRSPITTLLVDHLKRPIRDSEAIGKIIKAADDITDILNAGGDISSTMILLSDVRVVDQSSLSSSSSSSSASSGTNHCSPPSLLCSMNSRTFDSATEDDPVWEHAMEFRLQCSKVLKQVGPMWRAAMFLALSQELNAVENNSGLVNTMEEDAIDERHEEDRGTIIERFDVFAAALQQLGLIGIWNQVPLVNGVDIQKTILPRIPKGPTFRLVMEEQDSWMTTHPGASLEALQEHLRCMFPQFTQEEQGATVR